MTKTRYEVLKNPKFQSYVLFALITAIGLFIAHLIQSEAGTPLAKIGVWIQTFGFLFVVFNWTNPNMIVGWNGIAAIDIHPEKKNLVMSQEELNSFPLWKQPNRLKLLTSISVLFLGSLLQAIG